MNTKAIVLCISLAGLLCFASQATSSEKISQPQLNQCAFQETAELSIRFELFVDKAASANDEIEKIKANINSISKQQEIELITLKSLNFNLNSQRESHGNRYQLNGNMRYQIDTYQKSFALVDALKEAGYRVSLNVNQYRNRCQ